MSEPKQGNSRQARRDANQLERLFDLLPNDAYDVVACWREFKIDHGSVSVGINSL